MTDMTNLDDFAKTAHTIRDAARDFASLVATTQMFTDPGSGVGGAMGCSEANAFSDLLEAVGLHQTAADFHRQHLESEEDEPDALDNHAAWDERSEFSA